MNLMGGRIHFGVLASNHHNLIIIMATNPPKGDNHRNGAVRKRSQTFNPVTERFTKRDADTGRFMDQKSDGKPFKGVRKEK